MFDGDRSGGGFFAPVCAGGLLRLQRRFGSGGAAALGLSAFSFPKSGISSFISSANDGSWTNGNSDCAVVCCAGCSFDVIGGSGVGDVGNAPTSPPSPPSRTQRAGSIWKCGR